MFTTFTVYMALGKAKLGSSLLLDLGLPCCLGQLLDLLQTNSEASFSNSCCLVFYYQISSHSSINKIAGDGREQP